MFKKYAALSVYDKLFFFNLIIAIFRKVFSILVIIISIFDSIDDQRLFEPLLFAINTTDINQKDTNDNYLYII